MQLDQLSIYIAIYYNMQDHFCKVLKMGQDLHANMVKGVRRAVSQAIQLLLMLMNATTTAC